MTNKIWINRIYSADNRADLSKSISESEKAYKITNSQVEIDLRRKPSENKTSIKSGDIVYIAVNGCFEKKSDNSLRIVAKGVVDLIEYRNNIPVAVFVQGSFEHLTAPMINGHVVENNLQSPYWSITDDEANYIDQSIFGGSGVESI